MRISEANPTKAIEISRAGSRYAEFRSAPSSHGASRAWLALTAQPTPMSRLVAMLV